jgi:hypothetical protein
MKLNRFLSYTHQKYYNCLISNSKIYLSKNLLNGGAQLEKWQVHGY